MHCPASNQRQCLNTPSPLPPPPTQHPPHPGGDLGLSDCQGHHLASLWPSAVWRGPSGEPAAPHQERPRRSSSCGRGASVTPGLGGQGGDCSVPCVTVLLKDYLVLVFVCHRGNCVGLGMGAGDSGSPFSIKGATSLCGGWGREGASGAMQAKMLPRASKCSFLSSFILWFLSFFFFPPNGEFLTVLFPVVGERLPAGSPLWPSPKPSALRLRPPSLPVCPVSSLPGSRAQLPKAQSGFSPGVGGSKRLCTYFVCV